MFGLQTYIPSYHITNLVFNRMKPVGIYIIRDYNFYLMVLQTVN